jgi:HK97 family phage major capsid protein
LSDSEVAVQLAPAASTGADATVSGDTPPTSLTGPTLKAWKASSQPVFINRELITDSPIDIVQEIIGALLARIIRFENLKYTKGNGTTEAEGFTTNATAYHAGSVALDLDIPLDLAYSVPALYRPNGVYMASDLTVKFLRKLKTGVSGDKRSLWKDAFEEGNATLGTPARLHGYPILVNNDMDSVASDGTFAGVTPLVFGDFSKFVVRQAENGSPFARIYEVPAKDGRAAILFRRSDSKLLVTTAISKLIV